MAAPIFKLNSRIYFDKSVNSIINILQIDKVTVQYRIVNDDIETEITLEEAAKLVSSGIWTVPPKQEKQPDQLKVVAGKPTIIKDGLPTEENKITAYIQSIKRLKEGNNVLICLKKQVGWSEIDLTIKPAEVTIDLNSLDENQIKQIFSILNDKNEGEISGNQEISN